MFKVIIAGGRDFDDYRLLCMKAHSLLCSYINSEIQIVSGTAKGADKLGERYAKENYISLKQFPAEWSKYGKSAGYKRNVQMAEYADALIAFWDGKSKGTKHMIDIAIDLDLDIRVIRY